MTDYEGDERRRANTELAKLAKEAGQRLSALEDTKEELAFTRRSVDQMAVVLGTLDKEIAKAPSRGELDAARRTFTRQVQLIGAMLGALLLVLMIFSLWQMGKFNARLDAGHDEILCVLLLPPEQRTATVIVDCQQGG